METYVIATVGKLVELSFAKDVFLRYATRHASCFPGCLAEHRRVTIRKRMRLEKKKMDEKNARVDIKRGSVRSMLERCSTLMDSTYYTYHTCKMHLICTVRRARETRWNFVCACNDREIHCFDKRRLDFSLVESSIDAFASPRLICDVYYDSKFYLLLCDDTSRLRS